MFFFFCMRERSSLGDVFILFRAKKERCRRNLNLPLDQAAFSAIARKMKSMPLENEIHLFTGPISSLYRLISNTYSTPLGHPVDRYKKSLRSRHRHPMSPEGHPVGPSPTLIKTLFLSYSFKEKKKKKSIRFKVGHNTFPRTIQYDKAQRIDGNHHPRDWFLAERRY